VKVQYADEVKVVKNFRPMKAGNRLEGKTERTRFADKRGAGRSKVWLWCEGRKRSQSVSERVFSKDEGVERKLESWKDRMEGS
jgi:hypothetical protein